MVESINCKLPGMKILLWRFDPSSSDKQCTEVPIPIPHGEVISLCFAANGGWALGAIACTGGPVVVLWDLRLSKIKFTRLRSPHFSHSKNTRLVSISDDGRYALTGADEDEGKEVYSHFMGFVTGR